MPVRKLLSVVVGAGLMVSLAACSSAPVGFAGCTTQGNSSLVTADGAFLADPAATFPTPLVATSNDVHVVSKGDGERVTTEDGVNITVSLYDGKSGEPLMTQGGPITQVQLRVFVTGNFPFTSGLSCATVGSRVVTTGPAPAILGDSAEGLGLAQSDTIVVVTDIDDAFMGKANGVDQIPQSGYPAVVLAPNGRPGITFTSAPPPSELRFAALKQGNGVAVEEGDSIIVNMTSSVWDTKEVFSSTWDTDAPGTITVAKNDGQNNGVVEGLAQALVGQKVGSQVAVIVPPELGYAAGSAPAGVTETSTLFYVVDILAIG